MSTRTRLPFLDAKFPHPVPGILSAALLTPVILLIHGYHPFASDAGIYDAGIRHILDPTLYPLNAVFVTSFTHLSLFAWVIAGLVRFTHLPLPWILLTAHLVSIWLFLLACQALAARLFVSASARWCAVLLAAAAFTLPVAGTALFVMDPYVTPRSFSTPIALFAVASVLAADRSPRAMVRTLLLVVAAILLHPLMGFFAAAFVLLLIVLRAGEIRRALALCGIAILAAGLAFFMDRHAAIDPAYREAVLLPQRTFLFLARWQWYEILGLALPLVLYAMAARRLPARSAVRALCLTSLLIGSTSIVIAAWFVPLAGAWLLVPLQVLRSFHLIYASGIVLCGGVLGKLAARSRIAAAAVLVLIAAAMLLAQGASWPASAHVEWPGVQPMNPYQQAFLWIRANTPHDAVFAFNPQMVYRPGEEEQGFRAIAERDHLADDKDAGVVAVIPHLADRWAAQRNAQESVDTMTDAQRSAVLAPTGAAWLLLSPEAHTDFPCPWRNAVVQVCELPR